MMVTDRVEARVVYEKMTKCLFVWLFGHWVSLGYSDGMINSLMEGMGPITYDLETYASTFNQEAPEVDVKFNDN